MCSQIVKKINKNNGMTLIEIVVSIAVVGILAALVFTVISSGLLLAVRSGDNTKVKGVASGVTENWLGEATLVQDGDLVKVGETDIGKAEFTNTKNQDATIYLRDGSAGTVSLKIDILEVNSESSNNSTTIYTFRPSEVSP